MMIMVNVRYKEIKIKIHLEDYRFEAKLRRTLDGENLE
jgi:hypothetical protein